MNVQIRPAIDPNQLNVWRTLVHPNHISEADYCPKPPQLHLLVAGMVIHEDAIMHAAESVLHAAEELICSREEKLQISIYFNLLQLDDSYSELALHVRIGGMLITRNRSTEALYQQAAALMRCIAHSPSTKARSITTH